jgi:hypothetical protein
MTEASNTGRLVGVDGFVVVKSDDCIYISVIVTKSSLHSTLLRQNAQFVTQMF